MQTPSIKSTWHNKYSPTEFLELCRKSLKAQMDYVAYNPLRFGNFTHFKGNKGMSYADRFRRLFCRATTSPRGRKYPLHSRGCRVAHAARWVWSYNVYGYAPFNPPTEGEAVTDQISNLLGQRYLGDPQFEPVWAELNKIASVIFIHPADTVMPPHLRIGPCKDPMDARSF